MLLGETNINGITSFLFEDDGKLTGYQIIDWQKYPLDSSVFNELKKLQLSNNNKVIEDEYYKVILDLETGYKHYFKDNQEDLLKFYEMNGVDETLYQGKGKSTLRRSIGSIIFVSAEAFALCVTLYGLNRVVNNPENRSKILPLSVEEISEYIESSNNLNAEEKKFLNNELLFEDLLPYINKNPKLIEKLRYTLFDIDIQSEDKSKDWTGIGGYNDGTPILHVIGYEEGRFTYFTNLVDHEFCHNFQYASQDFNYLMEATNELLASEYFNRESSAYGKQIKIAKCLMEIVGVEPVLESQICGNPCYLYDILITYLNAEEIALFHIDKRIFDYTNEEKENRFEQLKSVLERLYYGMYGEDMWNNNMISSIMNDLDYERYYFSSEKIQNTEMYASRLDHIEKYTIEDAVAKGYVHPYIERQESVPKELWLKGEDDEMRCWKYSSNSPNKLEFYHTNNNLRIYNDDGSYWEIPLEEGIAEGYISDVEFLFIHKDPTSNLNDPNIKYDIEENCRLEGDNVIVTVYEKEYFPPIQKSVNVLN